MKRSEKIFSIALLVVPIILLWSSDPDAAGLLISIWGALWITIMGVLADTKPRSKNRRKRNEDDFLNEFGYVNNSAFNSIKWKDKN